MMFVLFDRTSRIAKPCSQKKSHEHGTNQSTHPSFMETCHQSGKSTIDFAENQPPTWGNLPRNPSNCGNPSPFLGKQTPNLGKSVIYFGEICHRVWGNPLPILGKSVTEFREISHRLWENRQPTLGKSVTDFGEIRHRLWENEPPTLGKSATDFGEIRHRLWENEPPALGK